MQGERGITSKSHQFAAEENFRANQPFLRLDLVASRRSSRSSQSLFRSASRKSRKLLEQADQHSTRFLAWRKSLAQFFLRLFERCFLDFPSVAKFGDLCFDLLGRGLVIECLLKFLDLRAGPATGTIAVSP